MNTQLPNWLQRQQLQLPSWANVGPSRPEFSIVIQADTDGYMREWLELLGVEKPDQYWLEVAYQCAKLDLQAALVDTPYDPRIAGKGASFSFSRDPRWALAKFPPGKGAALATQGREAREHYRRIRGRLPF